MSNTSRTIWRGRVCLTPVGQYGEVGVSNSSGTIWRGRLCLTPVGQYGGVGCVRLQ